jgi:single-stranded-DNA-specific exonuclease
VAELARRSADEIVREILCKRGFESPEARAEFLSQKPELTYSPFLLPDVEEGTDIIFESLKSGEKICIYGDYDADGIMSCVLLYEFLGAVAEKLGAKPDIYWYIPSRFDEGYGLNTDALAQAADTGANLVITVDCGSVSKIEAAFAKERGMKIVITDHHDCDAEHLPDCPLIDPKAPGSEYPFAGLSGCGVAFKTAQALRLRYFEGDNDLRAKLNSMLDLVAIATIADVVPLTDENRTLVKYGLAEINARRRPALAELTAAMRLRKKITTYNVSFGIAPHINAAGRMAAAEPVVSLFTLDDAAERAKIIAELLRYNTERRAMQDAAVEECSEIASVMLGEASGDNLFLLVQPHEIHEGIAGIVAGKLKGRFYRPTVVLSREASMGEESGVFLKGSGRSVEGVDIISMLRSHEQLFTKLGGHAMAAGFTMLAENEAELRAALNADMAELLKRDSTLLEPKVRIDAEISVAEVTVELAEALDAFEPTGAGNPKPAVIIRNARISNARRIGGDGSHLSFTADGLRCVRFSATESDFAKIIDGAELSLTGRLENDEWNGKKTVKLFVESVLL